MSDSDSDIEVSKAFEPKWPEEPQVEGGCFLPLDLESRTPHPDRVPDHIVKIKNDTWAGFRSYPASDHPWPTKWTGIFPKSSDNPVPTVFHKFCQLPLEIQRHIWRYTFPPKRLVEIFYNEVTGICTSSCPIPIALWVCQDSRYEALRCYKPMFATSQSSTPTVYFDPCVDEFYLGIGNISDSPSLVIELFESLQQTDLSQIRYLIIDYDLANYREPDEDPADHPLWWRLLLSDMEDNDYKLDNLETLTIVGMPSHASCNPSHFGNATYDIVVTEVDGNDGEFQAWNISRSTIVPWKLPQTEANWEVPLSFLWMRIEEMSHCFGMPTRTVRFVSLDSLRFCDRWDKRCNFFEDKIYVVHSACLHKFSSNLQKLLDLQRDSPEWYETLEQRISKNINRARRGRRYTTYDPLKVFLNSEICVCGSGHRARTVWYKDEEVKAAKLWEEFVKVISIMNKD